MLLHFRKPKQLSGVLDIKTDKLTVDAGYFCMLVVIFC